MDIMAMFRKNLEDALEDGHQELAYRIAWEWTEEQLMNKFCREKERWEAERQVLISKHMGM